MIGFKKTLRKSLKMRVLVYYLVLAIAVITGIPGPTSASVVPTDKSLEINVSDRFDREADMALIQIAFATENGQRALSYVGITTETFDGYLTKLSDAQINLLAGKLRAEMPAGGKVHGMILTLLLITILVFIILDVTEVYKLPFRRK